MNWDERASVFILPTAAGIHKQPDSLPGKNKTMAGTA
jgi:hypothetical protein